MTRVHLALVAGFALVLASLLVFLNGADEPVSEGPSHSSRVPQALRLVGRGKERDRDRAPLGTERRAPATPIRGHDVTQPEEPHCVVEGHVLWRSGSAIPNALARIAPHDDMPDSADVEMRTDAEGYFAFRASRSQLYDLYIGSDGSDVVARVVRGIEAPADVNVELLGGGGSIQVCLAGATNPGTLEAHLLARTVGEEALPLRRVMVQQSVVHFRGLEPGLYNIAIRGDLSGTGSCFVHPGNSTTLYMHLKRSASRSGVVVDAESGTPIGDCEVSLVGERPFGMVTSETGRFSLALPRNSRHAVVFRRQGYERHALLLESHGPDLRVHLKKGRTATVFLRTSPGEEVLVGRTVVELRATQPLYVQGPRERPIRHVLRAGESGSVRFEDLRSDVEYQATATSKKSRLAGTGMLGPTATETTVILSAGISIQGVARDPTGTPVSGARVAAVPGMRLRHAATGGAGNSGMAPSHRPGRRLLTTTDEHGHFSITVLPSESVGLWAFSPGYASSETCFWPLHGEEVSLTLRPARWLSGTVRDLDGGSVPGALILVKYGEHVYERVTTRADAVGHFSVYLVPADTILRVRAYGDGGNSEEVLIGGRGAVSDLQLTLEDQPKQPVVPRRAQPAGQRQGR